MKWIGQDIYDQVSRFRHDVYLEGISTSTETDMLVVDSDNKVSKRAIDAITVDVSDFMSNGVDQRVLTSTGTDAMTANAYLTFGNADNTSTLSLLSDQDAADSCKIQTTTHGATTLTTIDSDLSGDAAVAHFEIAADGDIILDASGQIKLEPIAGNNILLDGILTVDGKVVVPLATAHDTAGSAVSIGSGSTTAGTTNDIAGGSLTLHGGQGKGAGAGGDIIFKTANAGVSGSSLNALTTALTISDNGGATFAQSCTFSSGIIGTLSTAAQTNITSLGTLTSLVVDDVTINGNTITTSADLDIVATGNDIAVDTDNFVIESATSAKPDFTLKTTVNSNKPALFNFVKDKGGAGASGDNIGQVYYTSDNDAEEQISMAITTGKVSDATDGAEEGEYKVAIKNTAHASIPQDSFTLTGNGAHTDATIGSGTSSVTTLTGTLTMGSTATINNSGVVQVAAQTVIDHDQLANFAAGEHFTQANITTVGTIGTGVWEGTAIASDQQKHVMHYQTTGYSVPDGTNYDIAKVVSTNAHPFFHDVSIGSDGLTAQTVQVWARSGGHVMPRACTLKRFTGWSTAVSGGTAYIGLFKVTLADGVDSDPSAVLLEEVSYTAAGNATAVFFNETSFTATAIAAGDIVFTALKGVSGKTMYFNGTYEVEF